MRKERIFFEVEKRYGTKNHSKYWWCSSIHRTEKAAKKKMKFLERRGVWKNFKYRIVRVHEIITTDVLP